MSRFVVSIFQSFSRTFLHCIAALLVNTMVALVYKRSEKSVSNHWSVEQHATIRSSERYMRSKRLIRKIPLFPDFGGQFQNGNGPRPKTYIRVQSRFRFTKYCRRQIFTLGKEFALLAIIVISLKIWQRSSFRPLQPLRIPGENIGTENSTINNSAHTYRYDCFDVFVCVYVGVERCVNRIIYATEERKRGEEE